MVPKNISNSYLQKQCSLVSKGFKDWKINKQIKTTSTSHQKNIKQQHQKHSLYNNSLRLFLELIVIILLELKELRMKLMIQTNLNILINPQNLILDVYDQEEEEEILIDETPHEEIPKSPTNKDEKTSLVFSLPSEVQLDIFKYLNFDQLLPFQQSSSYFNNFIEKFEKRLPRKQYHILSLDCNLVYFRENILFKPDPKLYDFQLSKELEEKWKYGIEKSIPLFLCGDVSSKVASTGIAVFVTYNRFKLRRIPKNIEEMKIARYLLGYLFKCTFDCLYLSDAIINQQMLELLFDENKTNNLPLQIHSRRTTLNFIRGDMEQFLNFIYNMYLLMKSKLMDI
uniref:F-box domain-containing protein n=1 Tax=Meloidogyne enterolobii TaxID=390850 RepID=A0A6V7XZG4_MELEN|nr:unnamed protein product [Meloidogyne enterolobii]